MGAIENLEGDNKNPVRKNSLINKLVESERFNEDEANNYIKRMLYEASIWESKPDCFNRV